MKWRLMRKRTRGQQNIGDYCQCVLESKVAIFIHVLESCMGDIYWWDIGGYLLVRYWRVAEEYCVFLVLPICRTDVVSPSKVPKTKQNTPVEDASLPAPRTAWHLKCRLYWICVACNGGAIFFYFSFAGFFMSASGPVLPSWDRSLLSPRAPQGNGLQMCKVQQWLLLESFWWKTAFYSICQTSGLKTALQLAPWNPQRVLQGLLWQPFEHLLMESCTWWQEDSIEAVGCRTGQPSMRRPGASGRPRSAPRKTHGSQRVGPNKKLMIGMQRKEKKTNRKKTGPQPNGLTWPCWAMDSCDTGVTGDMKTALCLQSQCHIWHDVIWACWWCFFCVVCSAVFPLWDC